MRTLIGFGVLTLCLLGLTVTNGMAHEIKWRDGEPRQAGFGRCAKGPCTMRVVYAESRPHRHVRGKVIVTR